MPYEQHLEKSYPQEPGFSMQAAQRAVEKLEGKIHATSADGLTIETRFPKTILGNVLGERTYLSCAVRPHQDGCLVVVDAYPLDALERKLMFGARKGVTQTVVTWFFAHLENQMKIAAK